MKKLLLGLLCLCFYACWNVKTEQSDSMRLVEIYPQVVELVDKRMKGDVQGANQILDSLKQDSVSQNIIDDCITLVTRASLSDYELILPIALEAQLDDFVIIATLPRGIYNLGIIPNAKHFEFALSPSPNENGSEWNWEDDGLSRSQEEFIQLLGDDKTKKIVFYDSGEHISAPIGSAHIGIMWAKHLGYTQVYRLVGGFNAWRDLKLPISTQIPHCCEL